MKRILITFFALFLLLDLADDGHIGKAQFVAPTSADSYSLTSSLDSSTSIDTQVGVPIANLLQIPHRFPSRPALSEADCAFTLIDFYFLSSSGGLPL
jgi:hypothetical protein